MCIRDRYCVGEDNDDENNDEDNDDDNVDEDGVCDDLYDECEDGDGDDDDDDDDDKLEFNWPKQISGLVQICIVIPAPLRFKSESLTIIIELEPNLNFTYLNESISPNRRKSWVHRSIFFHK